MNSSNVKAVIGLSRGRVAFFEPLSNVMMDLGNPVGYIYEGTNTSELKSALGGAIYMISGDLNDTPIASDTTVIKTEKIPEVKKETKKTEKVIEKAIEKAIEKTMPAIDEKVEENKTEDKKVEVEEKEEPKKTTSRRRSKAE